MQQFVLMHWLLFGFMIFCVRWLGGAALESKATLDAREWQGFVNDLRESWTSPIMYLQKRGYLPKGTDHLLEEKISELQKENMGGSESSGGDEDKSALASASGQSYTDVGPMAGISNSSDASNPGGSANSALDSSSGSSNSVLDGTGSGAMDTGRILYSSGGIDGLPSSAFDLAKSFDATSQGDKNTPIEDNVAPMSSNVNLASGRGNVAKKIEPQKLAQQKQSQPQHLPKLQSQKQQGQQQQQQQIHSQQQQQHQQTQKQQQQPQQQQPRRPPGFLKKLRDKFAGLFSGSKKVDSSKPAYNFDFNSDFDRDLLNDLNVDGNSFSTNRVNGQPAGQRDLGKALDLKRFIMNARDTTANEYNAKDLSTRELAINDFNSKYPQDFASSAWKDVQDQRDYSMRDLDLRSYNVKDFDPKDLGARDTFDFSANGFLLKDAPARDFDMRDLGMKDYAKDFGESQTLLKETPLSNYNVNDMSLKEFNAKDTDSKDYSMDNAAGKDFTLGDSSLKEQRLRDVNSAPPRYLTRSSERSDDKDYEKLLDRNLEKDREFTKAVFDVTRKNALSHESVQSSSVNE